MTTELAPIDLFTNTNEVFGFESDVCERDALCSNADICELNMLGEVDGFVRHVDPGYDVARRTVLRCGVEERRLGEQQCSASKIEGSGEDATVSCCW